MEKIIVCVKAVPDLRSVKVDPETHTLRRDSADLLLNPHDAPAIELAMRLKERLGVEVVVLTMGPPNASSVLRRVYSLGADRLILLSDRAFAGSDTLATSKVLAKALEKLSPFSLVLMGLKSIDGETAQVPPETAVLLGIPSVTNVRDISVENGVFILERVTDYGIEELEVAPPLVVSVTTKLDYIRPPSLKRLLKEREVEVTIWNAETLRLSQEEVGLRGSPTQVASVFEKTISSKGEIWEGPPEELSERLIELLRQKGFLKS